MVHEWSASHLSPNSALFLRGVTSCLLSAAEAEDDDPHVLKPTAMSSGSLARGLNAVFSMPLLYLKGYVYKDDFVKIMAEPGAVLFC